MIRILKKKYKKNFYNLLQDPNGGKLKLKIEFKIENYFANESLKKKFTDKKFRKFLISINLP
jgi:hypothetical protein